jgi:hypothetical protein
MPLGLGRRFVGEAAFLIAVAVAAAVLSLTTTAIVAVMGGAWLAVALFEWGLSRRAAARERALAAETAPGAAEAWLREPATAEPALDAEPLLEPVRPEPVAAGAEPSSVLTGDGPPPLPEPVTPAREQVVERPEVVAVTEPVLEPEAAPEPVPEPARAPVVRLDPGGPGPREWNLWELEQAARAAAGEDAQRDEERSLLLMYLREYAGPDGLLPARFDALVRDAFADLLGSAAR